MKMLFCFVAGAAVAFGGLWAWDAYWRWGPNFGGVPVAEVWVFETSISAGGGGANLAVPVYRNTLNGERVMWAPGTPEPRWLRMGVPGS